MWTLIVKNLTSRTTEEDLKLMFLKHNREVVDVCIKNGKGGKKHFAFVRFYEERDAEDVLSLGGWIQDGQDLKVEWANGQGKIGEGECHSGDRSISRSSSGSSDGISLRSRSRSRSPIRIFRQVEQSSQEVSYVGTGDTFKSEEMDQSEITEIVVAREELETKLKDKTAALEQELMEKAKLQETIDQLKTLGRKFRSKSESAESHNLKLIRQKKALEASHHVLDTKNRDLILEHEGLKEKYSELKKMQEQSQEDEVVKLLQVKIEDLKVENTKLKNTAVVCPNIGCSQTLFVGELGAHILGCSSRLVPCPSVNCTMKATLLNMKSHIISECKESHSVRVITEGEGLKEVSYSVDFLNKEKLPSSQVVTVICWKDEVFLLSVNFKQEQGTNIYIQFLGQKEESIRYTVDISVRQREGDGDEAHIFRSKAYPMEMEEEERSTAGLIIVNKVFPRLMFKEGEGYGFKVDLVLKESK